MSSSSPTSLHAPRVVAVVPARGGSQGIPLKNLAVVGTRPLVVRAVHACLASRWIDTVVVSTDHPEIAEVARQAGALVITRPTDLAGHEATSESAVLHALDTLRAGGGHRPHVAGTPPTSREGTPPTSHEETCPTSHEETCPTSHEEESARPDPLVTVLVQCTSPFLDPSDLDDAITTVALGAADTAFSAVPTHAFLWHEGPRGITGTNHDPRTRRRRQDRPAQFLETGAFYVMRTEGLRAQGHRFFGRVHAHPLRNPLHAVEIDDPLDLLHARAMAGSHTAVPEEPASPAAPATPLDVDAIVTDFDGVHTDDHVLSDQDGREAVLVSREDGLGVALARRGGIRMLILSTETNPVVAARARKLRIPVLQGLEDKAAALREWMASEALDPRRVAYLGNDVNDLACFHAVGWPVVVADGHPRLHAAARLVLERPGGSGAVRELCDLVLRSRGARDTRPDATMITSWVPGAAEPPAPGADGVLMRDSCRGGSRPGVVRHGP